MFYCKLTQVFLKVTLGVYGCVRALGLSGFRNRNFKAPTTLVTQKQQAEVEAQERNASHADFWETEYPNRHTKWSLLVVIPRTFLSQT